MDSVLSFAGAATFVADNGDELTGTFEGSSTPLAGEGDAVVRFTITGGSRRFQDASGTMNVTAHGELMSTHGTMLVYSSQFTASGTLSYWPIQSDAKRIVFWAPLRVVAGLARSAHPTRTGRAVR